MVIVIISIRLLAIAQCYKKLIITFQSNESISRPLVKMEFDSEEEREIFGNDDEDEEGIESNYSSSQEGADFL